TAASRVISRITDSVNDEDFADAWRFTGGKTIGRGEGRPRLRRGRPSMPGTARGYMFFMSSMSFALSSVTMTTREFVARYAARTLIPAFAIWRAIAPIVPGV